MRIYAVDLLNAACSRCFRAHGGKCRNAFPAFEAFQHDLMDYLNSSDYTREFIRDSLRQARTLCIEMEAVIVEPGSHFALRARQNALGAEILALNAQIAAADSLLLQTDWNALFQPLREEIRRRGRGCRHGMKMAQLREEIRQGFTRWMAGKRQPRGTAAPAVESLADRCRAIARRGESGPGWSGFPARSTRGSISHQKWSPI